MATNYKGVGKPRFTKPGETPAPAADEPTVSDPNQPFSIMAELEAEAVPATSAEPEFAAPPAPVPATAVEIVKAPEVVEPPAGAAAASAAALPLKAFEAWSETANAYLDFAKALREAKTPVDVFELQSKFATERFDKLVRQSGEWAKLFQEATKEAGVALPRGSITLFAARIGETPARPFL